MRMGWKIGGAMSVLALAAASGDVMAPEDPAPLAWDRARNFPVVIVGTLEEGFEKKTAPERGTNTVLMKVAVDRVIKGKIDGKAYSVSVHEQLPKMLAARDAGMGKTRKYLLIMAEAKPGVGYMGKGHLDSDLERIYPWDEHLEAVTKAFVDARDGAAAGQVAVVEEHMKAWKRDGASGGVRPLQELLARAAAQIDEKEWKALGKERVQTLAAGAAEAITSGAAVGAGSKALLAIDQREGRAAPAGDGDKLRPALRKWIDGTLEKVGDRWPTELQQDEVGAAVELLGRLKDKDAKDVLVKLGQSEKWTAVRKRAADALVAIFGEEGRAMVPARRAPNRRTPLN